MLAPPTTDSSSAAALALMPAERAKGMMAASEPITGTANSAEPIVSSQNAFVRQTRRTCSRG